MGNEGLWGNTLLALSLYAQHALESMGPEKSKNCQKGGVQRILSIKGVLIKGCGKNKKGGVAYNAYPN